MANEAVLVFETESPIPFTVANGAGIEKGASLLMSDPMTVAQATTVNGIVGGIAASEKIASDGKVKLGVYRGGIFKVLASGSINVGDAVIHTTGTNDYTAAGVGAENIAGIALESCTNDQTFLLELKPRTNNLA